MRTLSKNPVDNRTLLELRHRDISSRSAQTRRRAALAKVIRRRSLLLALQFRQSRDQLGRGFDRFEVLVDVAIDDAATCVVCHSARDLLKGRRVEHIRSCGVSETVKRERRDRAAFASPTSSLT